MQSKLNEKYTLIDSLLLFVLLYNESQVWSNSDAIPTRREMECYRWS